MAVPNMIVTLVANTTKFNSGLRSAGKQTTLFGSIAKKGLAVATGAIAALGAGLVAAVPYFIKLGIESKKADARLEYVAKNMSGVGKETAKVVGRLKEYAQTMAYATGIDDEQIKTVQAKLLTFKVLEKTVAKAGGTFDRVTQAAFDLTAVGFGDAETNAVRLARMMQDPIKNIGLFKRVGIEFTQAEQDKIQALMESNDLIGAQEILLGGIEDKVGGLAEKTADPLAKLQQRFEDVGEAIGIELIPYLEDFADWIQSPDGKKAVNEFADAIIGIYKAVGDLASKTTTGNLGKFFGIIADSAKSLIFLLDIPLTILTDIANMTSLMFAGKWDAFANYKSKGSVLGTDTWFNDGGNPSAPGAPGAGRRSMKKDATVQINFNTPIDSVSAGREIQRVLNSYNGANGRRG